VKAGVAQPIVGYPVNIGRVDTRPILSGQLGVDSPIVFPEIPGLDDFLSAIDSAAFH